jgi:hypothetical protein
MANPGRLIRLQGKELLIGMADVHMLSFCNILLRESKEIS